MPNLAILDPQKRAAGGKEIDYELRMISKLAARDETREGLGDECGGKERWGIGNEKRRRIVEACMAIMEDPKQKALTRMYAARTLGYLDELDIRREASDRKEKRSQRYAQTQLMVEAIRSPEARARLLEIAKAQVEYAERQEKESD